MSKIVENRYNKIENAIKKGWLFCFSNKHAGFLLFFFYIFSTSLWKISEIPMNNWIEKLFLIPVWTKHFSKKYQSAVRFNRHGKSEKFTRCQLDIQQWRNKGGDSQLVLPLFLSQLDQKQCIKRGLEEEKSWHKKPYKLCYMTCNYSPRPPLGVFT